MIHRFEGFEHRQIPTSDPECTINYPMEEAPDLLYQELDEFFKR